MISETASTEPSPATLTPADPPAPEAPKQKLDLMEMAISFASPALFGKTMILVFGSLYSAHPGKGYGYGLIGAILFTVAMLGRFVWRYRNYSED